jgi:MFS family permease
MQAAFLVVFANDVYCFSSSYSFLPQHLALAGHTTLQTSMAFGSYGIVSIGVLILLLYINSTASGSSVSLNVKFFILLASTVACGLGSLLVTFLPNSYAWLVASKGIQGAASAVYFSYAFILISAIYPMEYQAQTAAFVTAGGPRDVLISRRFLAAGRSLVVGF